MKYEEIGRQCNVGSVAGIRRLKLVDERDLQRWEEPPFGSGYDTLTMSDWKIANGAVVAEMVFWWDSCRASLREQLSADGHAYEVAIQMDFWRVREVDVLAWLWANKHRRWVVFGQDRNGYVWTWGEPGNGLRLLNDFNFGTKPADKNVIVSVLSGRLKNPGWRVDSINFELMTTKTIDFRRYDRVNLECYRGDTLKEYLVFRDHAGAIESLTGSTFRIHVKTKLGAILISFVMGPELYLNSDETELWISKTAAVTATWPVGEYNYDLERTFSDGTVETALRGTFLIEGDVTM